MELADDDALRAVDDESPVVGHQGQGSEVNFLFLDVADGSGAGFLVHVVDDEAHDDFHGSFVSHAPRKALIHIVFHFTETVLDKFQRSGPAEILDGKHASEDLLEPSVAPGFGRDVHLQKIVVAFLLHLDQVGNLDNLLDFSKVLTHPVFMGQRSCHGLSCNL